MGREPIPLWWAASVGKFLIRLPGYGVFPGSPVVALFGVPGTGPGPLFYSRQPPTVRFGTYPGGKKVVSGWNPAGFRPARKPPGPYHAARAEYPIISIWAYWEATRSRPKPRVPSHFSRVPPPQGCPERPRPFVPALRRRLLLSSAAPCPNRPFPASNCPIKHCFSLNKYVQNNPKYSKKGQKMGQKCPKNAVFAIIAVKWRL
jgi:hypothetical protein